MATRSTAALKVDSSSSKVSIAFSVWSVALQLTRCSKGPSDTTVHFHRLPGARHAISDVSREESILPRFRRRLLCCWVARMSETAMHRLSMAISTADFILLLGGGGAIWGGGSLGTVKAHGGPDIGIFLKSWHLSIDVQAGYGSAHTY